MLSFTAPARHRVTFDNTYLTCATTPNPLPSCPQQSHHGGCQRSNINNMLTDYFTKKKNCARNLFVPPFMRGEIKSTTHYNPSLSALNDSGLFTEWHSAGGARAKEIEQQRREIEYHSGHKVQNILLLFFFKSFVCLLWYKKSFFIVFVTFVAFDHLVSLFT